MVVVDRDTAIARAMARDGVDAAAVQSRIDAQLSNDERIAAADVVVENSGTEAEMLAQLDNEWARVGAARKAGRRKAS